MTAVIKYDAQLGTRDTAILTASSGAATIAHAFVANRTGGAVTLNLSVHRAISGNVETFASGLSVAAGTMQDTLVDRLLALGAIVFMPNDSIHASAGAATSHTVTLTD
jgi:hypothetical protein